MAPYPAQISHLTLSAPGATVCTHGNSEQQCELVWMGLTALVQCTHCRAWTGQAQHHPQHWAETHGGLGHQEQGLSAWLEQTEVVEPTNGYLLPLHSGAHSMAAFHHSPPDTPNLLGEGRGRQTSPKCRVGCQVSAQLNL